LVDLDKERARLTAELERLTAELGRAEKLLANPGFTSRAPEAVVQKERDKLADYAARQAKLRDRLASLS